HLVHPRIPRLVIVAGQIVEFVATRALAGKNPFARAGLGGGSNASHQQRATDDKANLHHNPMPKIRRTLIRSCPSSSSPLCRSGSRPPLVFVPQTCGRIVSVAHQSSRV